MRKKARDLPQCVIFLIGSKRLKFKILWNSLHLASSRLSVQSPEQSNNKSEYYNKKVSAAPNI
jgi:hypothetical protein